MLTQSEHQSADERYRRLHAETGLDAYDALALYHAAKAALPAAVVAAVWAELMPPVHEPVGINQAIAEEIRHAEDRRRLRAGLAATQKLPVVSL
jgi:hypothetical protein